jgi:nifR3 family TIM-barrel protein
MNFWQKLHKPFFVLAPMADVTDAAFRRVIAKCGKPNVLWTEFVSADGLVLATDEGKKKLMRDLIYTEAERPIVAQLFSSNPDNMKRAAKLIASLGFDGLDINMGCPDKSIEKQGAGAAHIKNAKQAREVIRAAKEGAGNIPVSVKTRIGYNKDELDSWLPEILAEGVSAVTIHARTRKEMSKVPAQWSAVSRAVKMRNEIAPETLIIGNGDVKNMAHARQLAEETKCDGVMFGRAIFGNPWLFAERAVTTEEKLKVLIEHTKLFDELLGDVKSFAVMKKHFKSYISDFNGAAMLRSTLMQTNNALEVENVINQFLENYQKT